MTPLSALWLPIVLSAVIVFVASSIMHMLLPYHRSDYKGLPDEDKILPTLRAAGLKRTPHFLKEIINTTWVLKPNARFEKKKRPLNPIRSEPRKRL